MLFCLKFTVLTIPPPEGKLSLRNASQRKGISLYDPQQGWQEVYEGQGTRNGQPASLRTGGVFDHRHCLELLVHVDNKQIFSCSVIAFKLFTDNSHLYFLYLGQTTLTLSP